MALNQDTAVGFPSNVGGTLKEVAGATPVDNVFTFSSGGKVWQRIFDGGNSVYRASWLNITGAPSDKTALLNIALANSAIKTIEIDAPITLNSAIAGAGKTLKIVEGGLIDGTGTLDNVVISGNLTQQLISPTITITNSKSAIGKWYPTWFGALGDGVTDDYDALNYANTVANANDQKTISLISGTYLLGTALALSANVVLEFSNGAILDGSALSGSSAYFKCDAAQIVFGSDILVSGIYPTSGIITPVNFGAIRNDSTDTSAAQQAMWDYLATLTDTYLQVVYPSGNYYQASSVILPGNFGFSKFISISGYGVQIRTDQDIAMWDRLPINMTESGNFIDSYKSIISGFRFRGSSTIATPLSNQIGIRIGAIYSWEFKDLEFYRTHIGVEAQFSLQSKFQNIRTTQCTYAGISGRYGTWTGATRSNTSFNANTIQDCRFFNIGNAFCSIYLFGADQTIVQKCIIEGQKPQYGVYYDDDGNTGVLINTFQDIWFENTGGTVTTSTNFYLDCRGTTILKNIQRIYADYFFEAIPASSSTIIVDNIPYRSNSPSDGLFKIPNTLTGATFIFKVYNSDFSDFIFDSSNWVGAVLPAQMIVETVPLGANAGFVRKQTGISNNESTNGHTFIATGSSRVSVAVNTSSVFTTSTGPKLWVSQSANGSLANILAVNTINCVFTNSTTVLDSSIVNAANGANTGGRFSIVRARGTTSAPTALTNGDRIGEYSFKGYDGSALVEGARIRAVVSGTVSSGILPTMLDFNVLDSAGVVRTPFRLASNGQIIIPISPVTGAITDSILVRATATNEIGQIATTDLIATGTQYQLGYYAANGNKISPLTAITASHALKSDANGLPVAFDTDTEPSLTELSYVKGVTSPIQMQIGTSGSYSEDGDGVTTTFQVTHGLGTTPSQVLVTPTGADTAAPFYVTNKGATTFDVEFLTAPQAGSDNVVFDWLAK